MRTNTCNQEQAAEISTEPPLDPQPQQTKITATKIKRGRPAKKNQEKDPPREWDDDEVELLINLWSQHECLYNCKVPEYHNKDERSKAQQAIKEKLKEHDVDVTCKQIADKLGGLRTYFGAEKRKIESSAKSGAGRHELYFSKWRFYESLVFLADSFTPRQTESNLCSNQPQPPTRTPANSNKKGKYSATEEVVIPLMQAALEKMDAPSLPPVVEKNKTEDEKFCELVCEMLSGIPENLEKAMLKINIQSQIVQLKFKSFQSPNQSIHSTPISPPVNNFTSFQMPYRQ